MNEQGTVTCAGQGTYEERQPLMYELQGVSQKRQAGRIHPPLRLHTTQTAPLKPRLPQGFEDALLAFRVWSCR